jgi:hypothetical protein
MGVRVLNDFVKSLDHTNVIVLNVPHRHDLTPNSYINDEVKVFNRKIGKLCKVYKNLSVLPVGSDRDLYTRHGLHLNAKGKGQTAQKVALTIKDLFSVKKVLPIALEWEANEDDNSGAMLSESSTESHVQPIPVLQEGIHVSTKEGLNSDQGHLNPVVELSTKHENPGLQSKRSRRHPSKRNVDFLL